MDEETKKQIDDLKKQLEALKEKTNDTKVEVTVPVSRKLSKFNGLNMDVADWIEDAEGAVAGMKLGEQLPFIKRHLEDDARKEVVLPTTKITKVEDIFKILREAFGEKRSIAKLKKLLYSRIQEENESVRDFTRSMMDLASRMPNETATTRNAMLKEVIVDNLRSKSVREACEILIRDHPDMDFADVRAEAIRLGDRDIEVAAKKTARTNNVQHTLQTSEIDSASETQASSTTSNDCNNALMQITAAVQQLAQQQTQLVAMMSSSQQWLQNQASTTLPSGYGTTNTAFNTNSANPQNQFVNNSLDPSANYLCYQVQGQQPYLLGIQCFKCKNFGHYQTSAQCPLYRGPNRNYRGRRRGNGQPDSTSQNFTSSQDSNQGNFATPRQ